MRVAVAGDDAVAGFTRRGCAEDVPGAEGNRPAVCAGEDQLIDVETRDVEACHGPGVRPGPGRDVCFAREGAIPGCLEERLGEQCFGADEGALAELPAAEHEQSCGKRQTPPMSASLTHG